MDRLERILNDLPKPELRFVADFKISSRLRYHGLFRNHLIVRYRLGLNNLSYAKILSGSFALIFLFCSTAFYAYANEDVLPGSRLYPLKIAVENIEVKIAQSPVAKIQIYKKLSERRLKEAVILSHTETDSQPAQAKDKISHAIQSNIAEAMQNLDSASDSARNILNERQSQEAQNSLKDKQGKTLKYLDDLGKQADFNHDTEIFEKVTNAKDTIVDSEQDNFNPDRGKTRKVKGVRIDQDDKNFPITPIPEIRQFESEESNDLRRGIIKQNINTDISQKESFDLREALLLKKSKNKKSDSDQYLEIPSGNQANPFFDSLSTSTVTIDEQSPIKDSRPSEVLTGKENRSNRNNVSKDEKKRQERVKFEHDKSNED